MASYNLKIIPYIVERKFHIYKLGYPVIINKEGFNYNEKTELVDYDFATAKYILNNLKDCQIEEITTIRKELKELHN